MVEEKIVELTRTDSVTLGYVKKNVIGSVISPMGRNRHIEKLNQEYRMDIDIERIKDIYN